MENCFRESKDQYQLAYIKSLAAGSVFQNIEVSFLQIGHTHEYIDRAFSRKSEKFRSTDPITLFEFHGMPRNTYRSNAPVVHMK